MNGSGDGYQERRRLLFRAVIISGIYLLEGMCEKPHAGSAYILYLTFLKTSSITGLAETIEDCMVLAKDATGHNYHFWRDADRFENGELAKEIRALANCIKHNQGLVEASGSTSARFLVEQRGYKDNTEIR